MAATTVINGREAHWDEDNSVWVWTDTDERVATPHEQAVGIVMQAVADWELHNANLAEGEIVVALETVINLAMADVFVLVRNIFLSPGVVLEDGKN